MKPTAPNTAKPAEVAAKPTDKASDKDTDNLTPDPGLNVDKALEKAGELASDVTEEIVGYLDKLGLSGKPGTDDGDKSEVKPATAKPTARKSIATLSFDKVTMTDARGRSGNLQLKGRAEPGAKVSIFIGQRSIASVVADAAGKWSFSGQRNIPYGKNLLQAVHVGKMGEVLARAEYSLRRVAPKTIVAMKKPTPLIAPRERVAEVTGTTPSVRLKKPSATYSADPAQTYAKPRARARYKARARARYKARARARYKSAKKRKKHIRLAQARKRKYRNKYRRAMKLGVTTGMQKHARKYRKRKSYGRNIRRRGGCKRGHIRYRVRRGDSLWKISKRLYGNGRRYGRIYRANKKRIANPNRIYRYQTICIKRR